MTAPNILQKVYNSFLARRTGRTRRSDSTTAVGPLRGGGYPAAAAAATETACPGCGNDSPDEIYNCRICHEDCCSECADVRADGGYVVCNTCLDKPNEAKGKLTPPAAAAETPDSAARIGSDLPRLAVARGIIRAGEPHTPAACVVHHFAQAVPPRPAAPAAVVAAAPVAVAPAAVAPVQQDRAFFQALEKNPSLSNLERWNVIEALNAIDRGEEPAAFLTQRELDEQIAGLNQVLNTSTTAAEKWRAAAHLEKLQGGENPGTFVPGSVIDGQLAALEAALSKETDAKERCRLASQLDAVTNGAPFVSREQAAKESGTLESQLAAATCPRERYRLAEKLNAL